MAVFKSDSVVLIIVLSVNDQVVQQSSMCFIYNEKIQTELAIRNNNLLEMQPFKCLNRVAGIKENYLIDVSSMM